MQPVNASVVTGVAVQETNPPSDRVVVILRKDTRRMKYRTNVLVNDEIRYFDTMKMQRFEGGNDIYIIRATFGSPVFSGLEIFLT